jgi:hypothetical protein
MENVLLMLDFITVKDWVERAAVITDKDGRFVFRDVPSNYKVVIGPKRNWATGDILYGTTYPQTRVGENSTVDIGDIVVYKEDLQIVSPVENAHIASNTVEIEWLIYPSATDYQVEVYAGSGISTQQIDAGNNTRVTFNLTPAEHDYNCTVVGHNVHGTKIAVGRRYFHVQ